MLRVKDFYVGVIKLLPVKYCIAGRTADRDISFRGQRNILSVIRHLRKTLLSIMTNLACNT